MSAPETPITHRSYYLDSTTPEEKRQVNRIAARTEDYVVGLTLRGAALATYHIFVEIKSADPKYDLPLGELRRVMGLAKMALPVRRMNKLSDKIAPNIANAFMYAGDEAKVKEIFADLERLITTRSVSIARIGYAASSFISAALLLFTITIILAINATDRVDSIAHSALRKLIMDLITDLPPFFLLCLVGGILGALLSVLLRVRELDIDFYEPSLSVHLHGFIRIFLGGAFGAISATIVNAGLLFPQMTGQSNSLFLLAVVAGFSEKLIPDVLEKISNQAEGKDSGGAVASAVKP